MTLEGFPGPRRGPQLVSCAVEKKVPELALSHSHTDEYVAYHHRTFIWWWIEIETETHIGGLDWTPKVPMRTRRRENMSKEVRTARDVSTHWDGGTDLMGAHQGQLDWEWWSMWSNRTLWMWLSMKADWESKANGTGFWFYFVDWLCESLVCLDAQLPRPGLMGKTLDFPRGRKPWLLLGLIETGKRIGRSWRDMGGGEEVDIFN